MPEPLELPPIRNASAPSFPGVGKTPTSPEMKAVKLSNGTTRIIVAVISLLTAGVGATALKKATDTGTDLDAVKEQATTKQQLADHIKDESDRRKDTQRVLEQLTAGQQQQAQDQAVLKAMMRLELKKHGIAEPEAP